MRDGVRGERVRLVMSAMLRERKGLSGDCLEVFEFACGKCDLVVWDVDQEIAVAHADAAIAAYDFCVFVSEHGCCDVVCEGATVAGCFVCLGWWLGVRHGVLLSLD